jgi:hypothetical protein
VTSNLDPQIDRRPMDALRPYERNARKHPLDRSRRSPRRPRMGWRILVFIDEQDLLAPPNARPFKL